jgi:predicted transcriptional regulator of viral defense system
MEIFPLTSGELYRIARGLYSREPFVNQFLIIAMRYPNAVITADTAYYLHGLTDVIPQKTHLATKRNATRMADSSIIQVFVTERLFEPGRSSLEVEGVSVSVYDKDNNSTLKYNHQLEVRFLSVAPGIQITY